MKVRRLWPFRHPLTAAAAATCCWPPPPLPDGLLLTPPPPLPLPLPPRVLQVDDPFVPLPDDLLVNLRESRAVVEALLDAIPQSFAATQQVGGPGGRRGGGLHLAELCNRWGGPEGGGVRAGVVCVGGGWGWGVGAGAPALGN